MQSSRTSLTVLKLGRQKPRKSLPRLRLEIEAQLKEEYPLTPEDLEAIDRGLQDAAEGRFATDEQVESVFVKYRRSS